MIKYRILNIRWLILSIFVFILDQYSKFLALRYLDISTSMPFISHVNLTLTYNPGIAFSLFSSVGELKHWILVIMTIIISIIIFISMLNSSPRRHYLLIGLSFIFGGAIGNIFDRIFKGYVIDFIDFYIRSWHWPVFNFADSMICLGVFFLFIDIAFMSDL